MKKIWMLAAANLRKSKSQTISLLVFVLIAAMFLSIGLTMYFGISELFEQRAEAGHSSHFTAIYTGAVPTDEHMDYIRTYPGVVESERQAAVGGYGDYLMGGAKSTAFMYFAKIDEHTGMDAPALIGDARPLVGDAIYIPYFMTLGNDYNPGDIFTVNISGTELNFTIAGSSEEIMLGAQYNTIHRFYVSDEMFEELQRKLPEGDFNLLLARLENRDDAVFFQADYSKDISTDGLLFTLIIDIAKQARTMIPMIASIIVSAFSLILLIVSIIVIHFRIVNSIEESMVNIGALKSMGYRSRQVISSIVMQFGSVAVAGAILGVAASYAVMPLISKMMRPMIALVWNPGFDLVSALIPPALIVSTILLFSYLSSRRIRNLTALAALRGASGARVNRKNALPLDTARGSLDLLLAVKQLLRNKKQAAAIIVIVAAVSMASVAGISVNYNMNVESDAFVSSLFGEVPDVSYLLKSNVDGQMFSERLAARPEVRKVLGYEQSVQILADDISISAAVAEDCALLEGNMLIDGRYPEHDDEIALGTSVSKVSGKKPGDSVAIKSGDIERDFIVTGIVQYMNSNGFNALMSAGGYSRVNPGFEFGEYSVYLTEGTDVKTFLRDVEITETGFFGGDIFDGVMDSGDQLESMMGSMSGIFAAVAAGILAVTVCVVALTLYIIIKTTILRRRRELGIQKALGFTTLQLMNQTALNMTPVILAGVLLGAVAGYFGLNPMMALLMGGMGIVRTHLITPLSQTIAVCAALIAIAYAMSMLISWRIRKISAYTLVSE